MNKLRFGLIALIKLCYLINIKQFFYLNEYIKSLFNLKIRDINLYFNFTALLKIKI